MGKFSFDPVAVERCIVREAVAVESILNESNHECSLNLAAGSVMAFFAWSGSWSEACSPEKRIGDSSIVE